MQYLPRLGERACSAPVFVGVDVHLFSQVDPDTRHSMCGPDG